MVRPGLSAHRKLWRLPQIYEPAPNSSPFASGVSILTDAFFHSAVGAFLAYAIGFFQGLVRCAWVCWSGEAESGVRARALSFCPSCIP